MEDFKDILFIIVTVAVPLIAALSKKKGKEAASSDPLQEDKMWFEEEPVGEEAFEEGLRASAAKELPIELAESELEPEKPKKKIEIDKKKLVIYSEIMKQKF